MKNNDTSQVIILGNEFDKVCGLNISCYDFFLWRFKKVFKKNYTKQLLKIEINKYLTKTDLIDDESELTFWDVVLFNYIHCLKNKSWENFNEIIKIVVNYIFYPSSSHNLLNKDLKKIIDIYNKRIISKLYKIDNAIIKCNSHQKQLIISVSNSLINKYYENYYLDQLEKFEKNINRFCEDVKKTHLGDYRKKVQKKLSNLFQINGEHQIYKKHIILSFNSLIDENDIAIDNTIWKLEKMNSSKIIFGTNENNINKSTVSFSKFFRSSIDNTVNFLSNVPRNVNTIYFVGNVIVPSNYCYIDALFNKCDLLTSNVCLSFEYKKKYQSEHESSIKVSKLIYHYSKYYLDNNINLFYKLVVESRINLISD